MSKQQSANKGKKTGAKTVGGGRIESAFETVARQRREVSAVMEKTIKDRLTEVMIEEKRKAKVTELAVIAAGKAENNMKRAAYTERRRQEKEAAQTEKDEARRKKATEKAAEKEAQNKKRKDSERDEADNPALARNKKKKN